MNVTKPARAARDRIVRSWIADDGEQWLKVKKYSSSRADRPPSDNYRERHESGGVGANDLLEAGIVLRHHRCGWPAVHAHRYESVVSREDR